MRSESIGGKAIAYELTGSSIPLVWSPGGFAGIDLAKPAAAAFAGKGFRVLTYDRPTTGSSDLVFEDERPLRDVEPETA